MTFSQILAIIGWFDKLQQFLDQKPSGINTKKNKKLTLDTQIQTYQIDKWWFNLLQ